MSGRRHRDDDWDDDARRGPSDDRRDGDYGAADRGRRGFRDPGTSDRGPGDRGPGDPGVSGRGMSDRRAGDWGGRDRGMSDRGAEDYDFADWFVDGGKRRGGAPGGSAPGGSALGGSARGGVAQGGSGPGGGYRGPGYAGQGSGDSGRGQSRPDRGGYGESGYGEYRQGRDYQQPDQDRGFRDATRYDDYGSGNAARYNDATSRHEAAPEFTPAVSASPAGGGSASGRPYGRLSIFTLLDDRVSEFDQLAERAAEGVRSLEPDTLVYVIHVVPKAPMQRIIYEIYRDRAAFEAHERQPHIQQFAADSKSCVLATNIIDLRLKYAKVAPLGGGAQVAQAASGQASLPGPAPRRPRELESGSRAGSDGRHAGAGTVRYSGPGDGGYSDFGSGRHSAAGSARYANGDARYADADARYADAENGWFSEQGNGIRRPGQEDGKPGGERGQPRNPGRRRGGK